MRIDKGSCLNAGSGSRSPILNRKGVADNPQKYKVCCRHFLTGYPSSLFDDCSPDWASSKHLGYDAKNANEDRIQPPKSPFATSAFRHCCHTAWKGGKPQVTNKGPAKVNLLRYVVNPAR
ncbi:hypothetical protein MRX96_008967 [Rhipicephalus microplus]